MAGINPEKEGRLLAALLFSLGILQIAGFWISGSLVNGPGPLAIPQPDAPLYLQSAYRVAEGFPLSFSAGSAICTGSTTVLHPFLFAVPFLLGVGPDAAIAVSFAVNAAFYLVFLFAWGMVIRRWVDDPLARMLAVVMLALFGQTAYSALSISDIGLWLAVSSCFVAGLAVDRKWLYGSMLAIGPWVRPEGMVVAIAFFIVVIGLRFAGRRDFSRGDFWLAGIGMVSMLGVFAMNYTLTGKCQFSSVALKGHFAMRPFFAAVYCSATDMMRMCGAFLFGLTDDPPRQFYMLPVVGAAAFWIGVVKHEWADWRKWVFPLAAAGGLWTVATSGWQNTNVDRYVAWLMPLIVIFSATGFVHVYRRLSGFRAACVMLALPVLFSIGATTALWSLFHAASVESDELMKFGRELDMTLPADSTLGLTGNCGLAYPLRHHGVRTLYGIYSPEFEGPLIAYAMEILKNRPETRFDYWLIAPDDDLPKGFEKTQGEVVTIGPGGLVVRKSDWSVFSAAAVLPKHGEGLSLKQRVDVGYRAEERTSGYEAESRYGLPPLNVFQHIAELNGIEAYEAGRVIWGMDSMDVALEPGKDVTVVMRTLRERDAGIATSLSGDRHRHYDFGSSQSLNISVNGEVCATANYEVDAKNFTDVTIRIPGSAIVNPVSRIAFLGDHITCGYWFFQ